MDRPLLNKTSLKKHQKWCFLRAKSYPLFAFDNGKPLAYTKYRWFVAGGDGEHGQYLIRKGNDWSRTPLHQKRIIKGRMLI